MARPSKYLTMSVAVILAIYTLATIANASAQSTITKPAVPEFTAKYADCSYDVPPVYEVDPNTNQTIVRVRGYHVDNRTVQFTIKNQPFTPYTDSSSGKTINLFYNIKYAPTNGSSWTSIFGGERFYYAGSPDYFNLAPYAKHGYPIQNYSSPYTVVSFTLPPSISVDSNVLFQVQALEGYTDCISVGDTHLFYAEVNYVFYGEKSDWSNTQTVTLSESTPSVPEVHPLTTVPLSEPTPSIPEVSVFAVLPLFLVVLAVAIVLKNRGSVKRTDTAN